MLEKSRKYRVKINQVDELYQFIRDIESIPCDIDALRGRYVVEAKSILGLMTMDLSKPVDIVIHTDDEEVIADFEEKIKEIMVN